MRSRNSVQIDHFIAEIFVTTIVSLRFVIEAVSSAFRDKKEVKKKTQSGEHNLDGSKTIYWILGIIGR